MLHQLGAPERDDAQVEQHVDAGARRVERRAGEADAGVVVVRVRLDDARAVVLHGVERADGARLEAVAVDDDADARPGARRVPQVGRPRLQAAADGGASPEKRRDVRVGADRDRGVVHQLAADGQLDAGERRVARDGAVEVVDDGEAQAQAAERAEPVRRPRADLRADDAAQPEVRREAAQADGVRLGGGLQADGQLVRRGRRGEAAHERALAERDALRRPEARVDAAFGPSG